MDEASLAQFLFDLITVLGAGFAAGAVCRSLGVSLLVGYLCAGAVIGPGALGLVSQQNHELEQLAHAGALLLLFSIGIEFSPQELVHLNRFFLVGGPLQMALSTVPLGLAAYAYGFHRNAAILAGLAGGLSSTVLVFKALAEWGETSTPRGRRAIGVLLFQDVALVPLMLCVPLLAAGGAPPSLAVYAGLAAKSLTLVLGVVILRQAVAMWGVPALATLKSVELLVLFVLTLLGGVCWLAHALDLPTAIGSLATGFTLGGNRLSKQIDSIVLPFRETFAAVFFVTLGTLLDLRDFAAAPLLLTGGLVGVIAVKTLAGGVAMRCTGLAWPAALGMGMGLAQLGEFSFLLLAEAVQAGAIPQADYRRMLLIAMGTLLATPQLVRQGLRWSAGAHHEPADTAHPGGEGEPVEHALIVGIGLLGRAIASRLEMIGVDACLVDFSPVNLHPFAQQGFRTVAGDARDPDVLERAHIRQCHLAVVCVPDDDGALQTVAAIRKQNPAASIIVRCRYQASAEKARRAGANAVVSEEVEATAALLAQCERFVQAAAR